MKANENAKLMAEESDFLAYSGQVAGINVLIAYEFNDDRLVRGQIQNLDTHSNPSEFIEDYEKLKSLLSKKYGQPSLDKANWKNELFRDDPAHWGAAVSMGHLSFGSKWETNTTTIKHVLTGDNFKVTHGLVYDEKSTADQREKEAEREELNKL